MNILTCLWIEGDLPELQLTCLKSWLKHGYNVNLHSYTPEQITFKHDNVNIIKEEDDRFGSQHGNLPESDFWRFNYLYNNGGTWIDFDMFMLKKLPKDEIIISSEHCRKNGVFSRPDTDRTADIGIMRFPKCDPILLQTMNKIRNSRAMVRNISYMKIFQKLVEEHEYYKKFISEPKCYCPISWAFAKDIYYEKDTGGEKFGIVQPNLAQIKEESYTIHLWNNIRGHREYVPQSGCIYQQLAESLLPEYQIAIPSYNRPEQLGYKTLALLEKHNINKDLITIFVNDDEQVELYSKIEGYKIIPSYQKGIGKNRTWIRNYYPNGTNLIFLDDDIENVLEKETKEVVDLNKFFCTGFERCHQEKATLWGIPLVDNYFFMKNNVSDNLKYIGAVYGVVINQNTKNIKVFENQWEDYIFSIEHFLKDGKVIRFNNYGIKSKWYNHDGGICSFMGGKQNRLQILEESAKALEEKYPKACKVYYKKDGTPNLRLNHRFKSPKIKNN